jgi:hypothetical protein
VGLLEVWTVNRPNYGQRSYKPSIFRQRSAVGVWNGKTKVLERSFFSNRRYVRIAWSRDSAWFGFVTRDLRLEVFKR